MGRCRCTLQSRAPNSFGNDPAIGNGSLLGDRSGFLFPARGDELLSNVSPTRRHLGVQAVATHAPDNFSESSCRPQVKFRRGLCGALPSAPQLIEPSRRFGDNQPPVGHSTGVAVPERLARTSTAGGAEQEGSGAVECEAVLTVQPMIGR